MNYMQLATVHSYADVVNICEIVCQSKVKCMCVKLQMHLRMMKIKEICNDDDYGTYVENDKNKIHNNNENMKEQRERKKNA